MADRSRGGIIGPRNRFQSRWETGFPTGGMRIDGRNAATFGANACRAEPGTPSETEWAYGLGLTFWTAGSLCPSDEELGVVDRFHEQIAHCPVDRCVIKNC